MHNVTPTDRHAQSGSPNRVPIPSTTGLEETVSMFITPPFRWRHCGQLLGVAQATRDVSTPVTLFVAFTPWSSYTGRPKVSFYVQPVANTLGLCLRMSPVSANMSICFNFTASMNDGLSLVEQE
jgi:hypothetical protein